MWDNPSFDLPPLAKSIGPFAGPRFLSAVWEHHRPDGAELHLVAHEEGALPLSIVDGVLQFVGSPDLIDYRSPVGSGIERLLATTLESLPSGTRFELDSLPLEAAEVLAKGAIAAGFGCETAEHASAAVLDLPDTFDEYLTLIGKKERHELRRKRRRYEAALGPARFVHATGTGPLFDDFVRFHRMAAGEKGEFMTAEMEAWFAALAELPGWGLDALVGEDGHVTAAGFGYQDSDGYYLYNSSYNPQFRDSSPGVVLLGRLIELTIERGKPVFDFLKGDEHYKYRLGAQPRPLYQVAGSA